MKKLLSLTILAMIMSFASFAQSPIYGPAFGLCAGSTATLYDTIIGGVWTSGNTSVAVIDPITGVYSGVTPGVAMITYTNTWSVYQSVTVYATPGSISGSHSLCVGSPVTFSNASSGGSWFSSSSYFATVGSTTGVVTGVRAGTTAINYGNYYCSASYSVTVMPLPVVTIKGSSIVCTGSSISLSDSLGVTSGTWTSSNTLVAPVSGGTVTGMTVGTATISYTVTNSCGTVTGTKVITVGITPAPITGGTSLVCIGTSLTFSNATPGGSWSSTSPYQVSMVGSVATANHDGPANIRYTIGGCFASYSIMVNSAPHIILKGSSTVCAGSTITLSDSSGYTGGTWTSSDLTVATVSGGVVTGVSAGTVTISYTDPGGICGPGVGTIVITVTSTTTPGTITGASTVMAAHNITLSNSVTGGAWSSSAPGVGTIDATTGLFTGLAAGTSTVTYTVSGCSGPAYSTFVVTVTPLDVISGYVKFLSGSYYGPVKVWLITYDPTTLDLQAFDSTIVSSYDTAAYYEFVGVRTDSFRIKAAVDSPLLSIGYIPTYHTSSFYWYSANVLPHTSGTVDVNQDIIMAYGTVPLGPGFIGGIVTTGANKGTGVGYAKGLTVYLLDATGHVVKQTKTDASGNYGFSAIPLGTYQVFPEALNYLTTAYTSITLTSGAPTMMAASFIQHTVSYTITPGSPLVAPIEQSSVSSVIAFPNPSTGKLNIQWNELAAENGTVTVSDITGREVYKTTVDMTAGTGVKQLDLSALTNGVYMINVNSASINYNNKIQIAR